MDSVGEAISKALAYLTDAGRPPEEAYTKAGSLLRGVASGLRLANDSQIRGIVQNASLNMALSHEPTEKKVDRVTRAVIEKVKSDGYWFDEDQVRRAASSNFRDDTQDSWFNTNFPPDQDS